MIALTPKEANAVFDPEYAKEFDNLAAARVARMKAPFFGHSPKALSEGTADLGLYAEQDHD